MPGISTLRYSIKQLLSVRKDTWRGLLFVYCDIIIQASLYFYAIINEIFAYYRNIKDFSCIIINIAV